MHRRHALALLTSAPFATQAWAQQSGNPVETLAALLERNYVLPETGGAYAAMLRRNAPVYASIADRRELARRLTDDLHAVARDGHLRVISGAPAPGSGPARRPGGRLPPVQDARWAAPGVAAIRVNEFPGSPDSIAGVGAFMRDYAGAHALILDARTFPGGGMAEMDVMLPYLFSRETVVAAMDLRRSVFEERGLPFESPSLRETAGPPGVYRRVHVVRPHRDERRWFDAKVFYLTSSRTASAAEHLALALKRTHRALLIGAVTAGANHFGGFEYLGDGMAAFVPVGRTIDPDTGADWEGVGIAPDIVCAPEDALDEAMRRARA
jgi:hypothetical protein